LLQVLIIIPPISIFLCKRLATEKKERSKRKRKRWTRVPNIRKKKKKKDIYAAKFPFIFKIQKREVIFKYGAL
jgi:hypothetical protein